MKSLPALAALAAVALPPRGRQARGKVFLTDAELQVRDARRAARKAQKAERKAKAKGKKAAQKRNR